MGLRGLGIFSPMIAPKPLRGGFSPLWFPPSQVEFALLSFSGLQYLFPHESDHLQRSLLPFGGGNMHFCLPYNLGERLLVVTPEPSVLCLSPRMNFVGGSVNGCHVGRMPHRAGSGLVKVA